MTAQKKVTEAREKGSEKKEQKMRNENAKIFLEIFRWNRKTWKKHQKKKGEHDGRNVSSFSGSEEKST